MRRKMPRTYRVIEGTAEQNETVINLLAKGKHGFRIEGVVYNPLKCVIVHTVSWTNWKE